MGIAIQQLNTDGDVDKAQPCVAYDEDAIVVIGAGPVGMHFVNELVRKNCGAPVIVYGDEPWRPYDRVRLSSYLAGDVNREELELDAPETSVGEFEFRSNCTVVWIDRKAKKIKDAAGNVQRYLHLVLAVGSRPFVPAIGNVHFEGVYTFRSLGEADELFARRLRSRHTVVIGGGLLGLETARAMQNYNTKITVIEHNQWLMMQQLDEVGAGYLKNYVEDNGVCVELGDSVVSILGNERVEAVSLRSGKEISCDTVIIATGIKPNIELARDSGLSFRKGIRVNDYLETSDKNIYAIGECAEHKSNVYGLVKPGLDQAAVLADRLSGGDSKYVGSLESTRLKVMTQSVLSIGETGVYEESAGSVTEVVYSSNESGIYRKIRIFGNRLVGVIAVGDWHELSLLQDAILKRKWIMFWHLARFRISGDLWGSQEDMDIASWPAGAVVCNCTGVTRGCLTQAISHGCEDVACLSAETRAASVCGSCKPLLAEMLGDNVRAEPVRWWKSLLVLSAAATGLAVLISVLSPIPYADTVQLMVRWDELWLNSLFKQLSGFSMLALIVAALSISLRKRSKAVVSGSFNTWRYVHVVLGVVVLAALVAHTGLRLGDELNQLLMLNFLLLALAGAGASTIVSTEHRLSPALAKKLRQRWTWMHILLLWPLPVLLGFHVVKSYFF